MSRIFLKPRPGLSIPDPATRQPIPAEGAWLEAGVYTRRRLDDGDVEDLTEAQTALEAAAQPASDAQPASKATPKTTKPEDAN